MMYVLLYALCRGSDVTVGVLVTVTCRTGIMMLVVYCLFFGCAICLYFRLWVCNTVIGTVPVDG